MKAVIRNLLLVTLFVAWAIFAIVGQRTFAPYGKIRNTDGVPKLSNSAPNPPNE